MERLNQWLTLIANLGVVAGLALVAIELQQNTESLDQNRRIAIATAFDEHDRMFNEWYELISSTREAAEIYHKGNRGEELDEVDLERYRSFLNIMFRSNQATYQRAEALGQVGLQAYLVDVAAWVIVNRPHGQDVWEGSVSGRASSLGMTNYLEAVRNKVDELRLEASSN